MIFIMRRIQRPRPIQFLGEPIAWVETARYLGKPLILCLAVRHTSTR
jgi:hypothetical protein